MSRYRTTHTERFYRTEFSDRRFITEHSARYYTTVEGEVLETDAPVFVSGLVVPNGLAITLIYSDASGLKTTITPATTDYTINGTSSVVESVQVFESNVVLTMDTAIFQGETITIDYTPGANPLQDVAGNLAAALSGQSVANSSVVDSDAPVLSTAVVPADGLSLTLTYTDATGLDQTSTPATTDFSLSGTSSAITAVEVNEYTVVLTLDQTVYSGETVTIDYTRGVNAIKDTYGNLAAELSGQAVTNNSTQSSLNAYYSNYYDARTNKPTGAVATALELLCEKLSGDNNLSFDFLNNSDRFGLIGIDTMSDGDWAIDLKDPTKSVTDVNTTYKNIFSGVKGDAVSKYINTNWNPVDDGIEFTLNNASFWVYGLDDVENGDKFHGIFDSDGQDRGIQVSPAFTSGGHSRMNDNDITFFPITDSRRLHANVRNSSMTKFSFINGSANNVNSVDSTNLFNENLFINSLNANGSSQLHSDERIGAWGAGGSMTEAQCQELENILDWWFNFEWLSLGSEMNPPDLVADGSQESVILKQRNILTGGKYYLAEWDLDVSAGWFQLGFTTSYSQQYYTGGKLRYIFQANGVWFRMKCSADFVGSATNMVVKEIIGL